MGWKTTWPFWIKSTAGPRIPPGLAIITDFREAISSCTNEKKRPSPSSVGSWSGWEREAGVGWNLLENLPKAGSFAFGVIQPEGRDHLQKECKWW
jgi:hypothetical protein